MGKTVVAVTKDPEEARKQCLEYIEKTGMYARIVVQVAKSGGENADDKEKGAKVYVVYGYDEPCRLDKYLPGMTHDGLRILAGMYLRATKLRAAFDLMSRSPMAPKLVTDMLDTAREEKKDILGIVKKAIAPHPLTQWCENISAGRGALGAAVAIVFLGYIDPHEATTAGKAKRYWGYCPGAKLRHGAKASFNPWLKGFAYFTANRVLMGKDSYYYPLYEAKKAYYVAAGAKAPHMKALYWLAALLVSHAQQILRTSEGYDVPRHRLHIEPKAYPDQEPPADILEAIRRGAAAQMWGAGKP